MSAPNPEAEGSASTDPVDAHGHVPVMMTEVLEVLAPKPGETVIDATAGRGGHALELAHAISPGGTLVLFDLDPENLSYAHNRVLRAEPKLNVIAIQRSFVSVNRELRERPIQANALLADLGFASNQVERPERGFSFVREGPLDMRLDPGSPLNASDLLLSLSERELADLIRRYGEDPAATRIARKIVAARSEEPIQSTAHLARLVCEAYGPRTREARVHPATRTFQALRIAVNDEIGALEALLAEIEGTALRLMNGSPGWLAPGARIAMIGFHSLEDRLVKQRFARMAQEGLLTDRARKPLTPARAEIRSNPRARSAKLRCATVGTPPS